MPSEAIPSALKEHFQLREMEVPTSEERLRWSLNRFLAAAAKKQFPARIVIVLDAVTRLRGESSAADTLHWLPTELPQGVRIIVSTVELEQSNLLSEDLYDEGSRIHRTYTELRRRKCPTIRLQPLSVEVRHLIIGSFLKVNQQALQSLEQAQGPSHMGFQNAEVKESTRSLRRPLTSPTRGASSCGARRAR